MLHPYTCETAYQWLKHFVYVKYGCGKQSEVDVSIYYDEMVSFPFHKVPQNPKSGDNLACVTV